MTVYVKVVHKSDSDLMYARTFHSDDYDSLGSCLDSLVSRYPSDLFDLIVEEW